MRMVVAAVVLVIAGGAASAQTEECADGRRAPSMSAVARGLTDKGPTGHDFTEIYGKVLGPWRSKPVRIFEIGIASGGSLRLWNAFFPRAAVYAIDVQDGTQYENARTKTFVADQANREQLAKAVQAFGGEFDVILDDGGHRMEQQQVSLGYLFPHLKPGGYYIIEDLHTSLTSKYSGGGYGADADEENTTLRMLERYIHGNPPVFVSKYLLPREAEYLSTRTASVLISFRDDRDHSMAAILRKR